MNGRARIVRAPGVVGDRRVRRSAVGAVRAGLRRPAVHPPRAVDDRRASSPTAPLLPRATLVTAWHTLRRDRHLARRWRRWSAPCWRRRAFLEQAAQPVLVLVLVAPWVAYFTSIVHVARTRRPAGDLLVAFVTTPAFVFATVAGMRSADPAARELLASVDAPRAEVLWRLRLPSALPSILAAARFATGLALAAAYYSEGGSAAAGVGSARSDAAARQSAHRRIRHPVGVDRLRGGARRACSWSPSRRSSGCCCAGTSRSAGTHRDTDDGTAPRTARQLGVVWPTDPRRHHAPARRRSSVLAPRLRTCSADVRAATTTADDGATADVGDRSIAGEPFPADRCEANKAAGTITYLSGFDFAATASIIDVVVADERGYYDELCLDVELTPSFSTANYPLVAGGEAQFASGGSFSEVVNFAAANDADLVALVGRGPHGDRRADRASRAGGVARGAGRIDDRRQGRAPAGRGGDARRGRAGRGRGLRDGAARRLRPGRPLATRRHRRLPRLARATSRGSSSGRDSSSTCSTRPTTTSPARSA